MNRIDLHNTDCNRKVTLNSFYLSLHAHSKGETYVIQIFPLFTFLTVQKYMFSLYTYFSAASDESVVYIKHYSLCTLYVWSPSGNHEHKT
jgi:hypothetical protein